MMNPYPGAPEAIPELIEAYASQPESLVRYFNGVPREKLTARPVAGKWSMLEWLAHVVDSDVVIADRIKRCIAEERALLIGFDERLFAERLFYHEREPAEELELMKSVRRQTARILRKLAPEAWDKLAVHNERGFQSTKLLVQIGVGHINHHLPFLIEKCRALSLPC